MPYEESINRYEQEQDEEFRTQAGWMDEITEADMAEWEEEEDTERMLDYWAERSLHWRR